MTVTANIHVGVTAWVQFHAYSLGTNISNGGNAYRCITAGTSQNTLAAGPTGTGSDIVDGTVHWKYLSGIDYTTLQAWATALPGTLSQPMIGQVWNDGVILATSGVALLTLTGHTTSGVNTITLIPAPGESHRDASGALAYSAANGVAIQMPASGVGAINYIVVADSNVIFSGLQFQDPNSGSGSTIIDVTGNSFTMLDCIVDGYPQTGGAIMVGLEVGCSIFTIANCLLLSRAASSVAAAIVDSEYAGAALNGAMVNCTAVSVANTETLGWAILCHNTNAGGLLLRNTGFFRWTDPAEPGAAAAGTVDHCATDQSSFSGSLTDNGGNVFNAAPATQLVDPATDFRLKAGSALIDVGTTDATHVTASDDIRRVARPKGSAWDIGAFEFGATIALALGYAAAQVPLALKAAGATRKASGAQVVGLAKVKAGLQTKILGAIDAQVGKVISHPGLAKAVASAQAFGVAMLFPRTAVVAARQGYAALVVRTVGRLPKASQGYAAAVQTLTGRLFTAATPEAAHTVKTPSRPLAAVNASVAASMASTGRLISAVTTQAATFVVAILRRLSLPLPQASSASLVAARVRIVTLSAATPAVQAVIRVRFLLRSFAATTAEATATVTALTHAVGSSLSAASAQTAASARALFRASLPSATQGYAAAMVTTRGHQLGLLSPEALGLLRNVAKLVAFTSPETTVALKTPSKFPAVQSGSVPAVLRQPGKPLSASGGQSFAMTRLIAKAVPGAVTAQLAAFITSRAIARALATSTPEGIGITRMVGHASQAATAAAQAVLRVMGYAVTAAQANVAASSTGIGRPLSAASASVAFMARVPGRALSAAQAETAHFLTHLGHIAPVAATMTIAIRRNMTVFRAVLTVGRVSVQASLRALFETSMSNTAGSHGSRALTLGSVLALTGQLVTWYRLFVPESQQQGRTVLPPADGPAEPPEFSAMDPADQETLIFDWGARALPNDPIVSVHVVSVPPGLNFNRPIWIDNLLIEVTVGPFTPPILPITYGVRCTVVFASGRRSSYTIALPVRTL